MQSHRSCFDPFEAMEQSLSPVSAIHNVLLIDVLPDSDGFERLLVERAGVRRELAGGRRWSDWSRSDVGRYGHLVPVAHASRETPAGGCYFRRYVDQSLRRVPELDDDKGNRGWQCDGLLAQGFLAPAHIVPGSGGQFVRDETVPVTVRVPPEFLRECRRVQLTPQELLASFIGDAAGIRNFVDNPRADGFGSNGSDERDMAAAWIDRAFSMRAVDVDELDLKAEELQEREGLRDDFGWLLEEFTGAGGDAGELFRVVQALVDRQQNNGDEFAK